MAFLDAPPPEPDESEWPQELPFAGDIGVPVAIGRDLLVAEDSLIVVQGATLYRQGACLSLMIVWRRADDGMVAWRTLRDPTRGLRVGVEMADGSTATLLDRWPDEDEVGEEPERTTLQWSGVVHGFPRSDGLWLSPLPTELFTLHARWPDQEETGRVSIDATTWRARASDAIGFRESA